MAKWIKRVTQGGGADVTTYVNLDEASLVENLGSEKTVYIYFAGDTIHPIVISATQWPATYNEIIDYYDKLSG